MTAEGYLLRQSQNCSHLGEANDSSHSNQTIQIQDDIYTYSLANQAGIHVVQFNNPEAGGSEPIPGIISPLAPMRRTLVSSQCTTSLYGSRSHPHFHIGVYVAVL